MANLIRQHLIAGRRRSDIEPDLDDVGNKDAIATDSSHEKPTFEKLVCARRRSGLNSASSGENPILAENFAVEAPQIIETWAGRAGRAQTLGIPPPQRGLGRRAAAEPDEDSPSNARSAAGNLVLAFGLDRSNAMAFRARAVDRRPASGASALLF